MKFTPVMLTLIALLFSNQVSASWLDSILGSSEENPVTTEAATAHSNPLVGNVMSQLGLDQNQAQGGLGTLLSVAKDNLSGSDFSQLSNSIPGADSLLSAVPALAGDSGMTGLLSKAGDLGASMQGSAMVYDAFEKLGISKQLVGPMINIAKSYLDENGSQDTAGLLMQGVSALL
ncbi:DUF2780 domain-containing protein [Shewanella intestini]|uniref:DUF2780 domain-containing protein n=1 Tax=Shewanella intestini TaxID=2017544 RepID=A0ABS5I3Y0_9GAMM|nr:MULTISPECIES: DUF2780 domain-containing protein [Shewanella]MBR9728734.1 DUF2780 domain-containing protein [Shewanella intestini]MRG36810.1 DUF2780 domain-containing protein [Shewanella sp. XMDDZSB0408]